MKRKGLESRRSVTPREVVESHDHKQAKTYQKMAVQVFEATEIAATEIAATEIAA